MGVLLQALLLEIPEAVETDRLLLRATRCGMGRAIEEAVYESLPQLQEWMPWAREPQSGESAERHCTEMELRWRAREELDFCVMRKADGVLVGKAGLHTIDWTIPRMEIGYWLRTSALGQGMATEATLGLVELGHTALHARRLEICCDTRNLRSRHVAERSGFVLEGIRRQSRRDASGQLADSCLYARIF